MDVFPSTPVSVAPVLASNVRKWQTESGNSVSHRPSPVADPRRGPAHLLQGRSQWLRQPPPTICSTSSSKACRWTRRGWPRTSPDCARPPPCRAGRATWPPSSSVTAFSLRFRPSTCCAAVGRSSSSASTSSSTGSAPAAWGPSTSASTFSSVGRSRSRSCRPTKPTTPPPWPASTARRRPSPRWTMPTSSGPLTWTGRAAPISSSWSTWTASIFRS